MAEAILKGLLEQGKTSVDHVSVLQRSDRPTLSSVRANYEVHPITEQNAKVNAISKADIIILAVKPKDVSEALDQLREGFHPGQLLISVAAGLSEQSIQSKLGLPFELPIVRTMPNTSSAVGLSATGVAFSPLVSTEQQAISLELLRAIGIVEVVEEDLLHIVTGVSGSGPAYYYAMMEAMIEAGVEGGLSPETAKQLTVQTVLGAANMVLQSGEDPSSLRVKVTSPNGTTQAALEYLKEHDFANHIKGAVDRATARSREMGEQLSK
jgi:pyrroline-5-carboxylate reductase